MTAATHPACDRPLAQATLPDAGANVGSRPRWVLATCILASSLAFVDGSVVNVGLPAIGRQLRADAGAMPWVVNAYLLPLSALLLLGGAVGDRFGRRRALIVGTAVFALASLACSLAPGLGVLLGGRLAQGVGAALLMPNSLALLGATFTGDAKGRAIGVWAAAGAAMGAVGPVLGGWLIDTVGWRAIFWLNLPLALGAIGLAWRFVPRDRDGGDRALDAAGAGLVTLGLGAATWALTLASSAAGAARSLGAVAAFGAVALGALGAFVAVERRRGARAMLPLALFAAPGFVGLSVLTALLYGALGGLFVLLPFLLITVAGYTGTEAGAALLPLPLVLAVASPGMGALAARLGPRRPLTAGPLVVGVGFLLMLRIDARAAYAAQVLPALLVLAVGMSGAVAPLTTAVLASVDERFTGVASGFNSAIARTGGLLATALVGAVLAARGALLVERFHGAAVVSAGACLLASAAAFVLLRPREKHSGGPNGAAEEDKRVSV